MKIKPDLYPVLIIVAMVVFTILGLVLGFVPSHGGGKHNLLIQAVLIT